MSIIPEVKKKGFFSCKDSGKISDNMIEKFKYNNHEYKLIYKSMDPLKKEMVVVEPEIAKRAIKEFIENEIGHYIDDEFKLINKSINDKVEEVKTSLKTYIDNKVDMIAEQIVTELISTNFKEAVNKKIDEKLNRIKDLLIDE